MSMIAVIALLLGAAQVAPPFAPPSASAPPPIRSQPIDADYWITTDDYPAAALRIEAEGEVRVGYRVGADGRVSDCKILRSSGNHVLDSTTCTLITTRGRFIPARDHAGRAVPDSHVQRVVWTLPAAMIGVGFVPGYVAAAVPVYSQSRNACALSHSAPDLELVAEGLCGELPVMLSRDERRAPTSQLPPTLAVMTLTGEDGRLPRRPRPRGTLQYREEASFEVSADGTVTNCRSRTTRAWRGRPEFDICRFVATTGVPFFSPASVGPARRGRMTVELYATERYLDISTI